MYRVKVPVLRGKYKPGDLLPEDFNVDVSWIDNGIVELIKADKPKTKTKKEVKSYE